MQPDMSRVGGRIKELRERLGLKQESFGARIGVNQTTVSRWESNKQDPDPDSLLALANLAGTSVEEFLGVTELRPTSVEESLVIGKVQAGDWKEVLEWDAGEVYEVTVKPAPEFAHYRKFALEVAGPSMDLVYPPGSVVICINFQDLGREPLTGERVVVERKRHDGLIEATVKEYALDREGKGWLWPRSSDPRYATPIDPADHNGDIESVRVLALVIGSYRPE